MALFQSLWIGRELSPLEAVCIRSFLGHGHAFRLYTYQDVTGIPPGCERADAREILPESAVFTYRHGPGQGMYAGFANLFRYKLLLDRGGWWVDTDVVCLTREVPDEAINLARENPNQINNAIMRFPAGHPVMHAAYERAMAAGRDIAWGDTGPLLVTELVSRAMLEQLLAPTHAYYPVPSSQYSALIDPQRRNWVAERIAARPSCTCGTRCSGAASTTRRRVRRGAAISMTCMQSRTCWPSSIPSTCCCRAPQAHSGYSAVRSPHYEVGWSSSCATRVIAGAAPE